MGVLRRLHHRLRPTRLRHLERRVLEVRDLACLKQAFAWDADPVLEGAHLHAYAYPEDLNQRRLRDAEALGAACRNARARVLVEIGTGEGFATALMARNAPDGVVHTVNIPPEEIAAGGRLVTGAPERAAIGSHYRACGLANIVQVLANTLTWEPDVGTIDVAFIDGCHDADFVFNDTRKLLARCRSGSLVLWHDFAPGLRRTYDWIDEVCRGVDRLYAARLLDAPVYHLRDSWVGLYRVP